jgi:hypothetical protein
VVGTFSVRVELPGDVLNLVPAVMVEQADVLKALARRSKAGRSTASIDLVREFDLPPEAACGHLERLWRNRLIETTTERRPRYRFRLLPGEHLRDLRFQVTARGEARLDWEEAQQDETLL